MSLVLSDVERSWLNDDTAPGRAMAMRMVVRAAEFLGAERMVPIVSAHIDGCLYHGDGGVRFVETLRERSPSDDQKPPGEEASVITPPPQAAKTAWPEESKAAVQKTLNPSPDNSVDGAGQPVSPV